MLSGSLGTGGTAVFVPERSLPVRGRRGLLAGMMGTAAGGTADGCGAEIGIGGGLTTRMLCELVGGGGGSIVSPGDFRSGRGDVRGARGDSDALALRLDSGVTLPLGTGCAGGVAGVAAGAATDVGAAGTGGAVGAPGVAVEDTVETGLVAA